MQAASDYTRTLCTPEPGESWMFAFHCPHCARELRVPEQYLNVNGRCNHCRGQICPVLAPLKGEARPQVQWRSREWFEARHRYIRHCRDHYEAACRQFGQPIMHGKWELVLEQAKQSDDREKQKSLYLEAIVLGCPWAFPYERLGLLYAREKNYAKAHDLCAGYFEGEHWKTPQWLAATEELLNLLERIQRKLDG